jgi:predicted HD phosphohydrolase
VQSCDELLGVLTSGREARDEEDLDLLAHSLQCAQLLAERAPDDLELQVAGLVHDIGTMLEPDRPRTHSATGAAAVEPLLGARVAALVRGHDVAKRYLVVVDESYRSCLTERSIETMGEQGGPLDHDERAAFESDPHFDALVTLRRADDEAKDRNRHVPPLETWRARLESVAAQHAG